MIKKIDANKYGVVRYAISSIEDIADLPREVSVGSEAILVNEDGEKKFRLGSDGWVEVVEVKEYDEDKLRDILEDAKVGYGGIEYETLEERLDKDFDNAYSVLDNRTYVEYEGCRITAKDSLNGLQKETVIKGRTLQNLVPMAKLYSYNDAFDGAAFKNQVFTTKKVAWDYNLTAKNDILKLGSTYTVIIDYNKGDYTGTATLQYDVSGKLKPDGVIRFNESKRYIYTVTMDEERMSLVDFLHFKGSNPAEHSGYFSFTLMILEGDYTQTPLGELPFIEGIESVGDKSKNLCDNIWESGRYTITEGKLFDDASAIRTANFINCKPSTTYTITTFNRDRIYNFNEYNNGVFIRATQGNDQNPRTITTSATTNQINFSMSRWSENTVIQIEEGETATPYQEYYDGYKISGKSCEKNLFDYNKLTYGYYFNPTTGEYMANHVSCTTGYIKFNKCNITISGLYNQTSSYVGYYDINYNYIGRSAGNPVTEHKLTVGSVIADSSYKGHVVPANTEYITLNIYKNNTVNPDITNEIIKENIKYLQIEENSTATPYEPYKESTYSYILDEPLRSLPDGVCDEIDLEKGIVTRRVGKVVLCGSETWELYDIDTNGNGLYNFRNERILRFVKPSGAIVCDSFRVGDVIALTNYESFLLGDRTLYIRKKIGGEITDVDTFKQWLSKNPVTIHYELAEPTIEYLIKGDKFVTLPNGVKDEVGRIVTRNVDKIVFDGSNDEPWEVWEVIDATDAYGFVIAVDNLKRAFANPLICNTFECASGYHSNTNKEEIFNGDTGRMGIKIFKNKLADGTVEEFRKWLSQNPTTVYYQVETPYIECSYEVYPTLPNGVADEIVYNSVLRKVGKVVVDGSQVLTRSNTNIHKTKTTHFSVSGVSSNSPYGICDKLPSVIDASLQEYEEPCMKFSSPDRINPPYALWLNIDRSNADTVEEAYEYFRNNPHTVWYELRKPYVEPINLDEVILDTIRLKSYEPITHITSDNYLLPTIETQVPSDFNAVVLGLKNNNEALASQVMSLRQTNDELEATNREQDDVIDVTLLALDEVYGMIDEGEIETMSIGSPMVNVYVKMIKRGIKTLDEVPAKYRAEVEKLI